MARFTDSGALARRQKERFERLRDERARGLRELAEGALKDAVELTGGTLSKAQTKGAFVRRSGPQAGSVPSLPINVQSGRLKRALKVVARGSGDRVRYDVVAQGVAYAQFVLSEGGMRKAVDRGFKAEVNRRQVVRMKAFVEAYRRKRGGA